MGVWYIINYSSKYIIQIDSDKILLMIHYYLIHLIYLDIVYNRPLFFLYMI